MTEPEPKNVLSPRYQMLVQLMMKREFEALVEENDEKTDRIEALEQEIEKLKKCLAAHLARPLAGRN